MASTVIKSFADYTNSTYTFSNLQSGDATTTTIGPDTTTSAKMNVPWCDSQKDFDNGKYITIVQDKTIQYYVWQHGDKDGDFVRYSPNGYVSGQAPHVPGQPSAGGDKGLAVMADSSLLMTFYK